MVTRWTINLSIGERRSAARNLRRELLALKGAIAPLPSAPLLHTRPQLLNRLDQLKVFIFIFCTSMLYHA